MNLPQTGDTVEALYRAYCEAPGDMREHLPRLRELSSHAEVAVEFGVRHGASSAALLMGAKRVISYDIRALEGVAILKKAAGDRWTFIQADTRAVTVPACDVLFYDSMNTYAHLAADLSAHVDKVRSLLVVHNTVGYGCKGDGGGLGIRPAIDDLMIRDDSWRLLAHYCGTGGLLVLGRR